MQPFSDPAVATAWLAATVGARLVRSKFREVCIPAACAAVAQNTHSLRTASLLLHGLSLIYRHKVNAMASQLLLVSSRTHVPVAEVPAAPQRPLALVRDDLLFHPDDLVPLWGDAEPDVRAFDDFLNGFREEPCKVLFMELVDLLAVDVDTSIGAVNFSFNAHGDIDFDEQVHATTTAVTEFSRSDTNNDPHFQTQEQPQPHAQKRVVGDASQHVAPKRLRLAFPLKTGKSLAHILRGLARESPPFLNLCFRSLYPAASSRDVSLYPSVARHGNALGFHLQLLLKDIEVERGRNAQAQPLIDELDLSFGLSNTTEYESSYESSETETATAKFLTYIEERAKQPVAFSELVPQGASREIALRSFASVLELASKGKVKISGERTLFTVCAVEST